MLVIVHHWYVKRLLQTVFNIETFRCLDILEVDAAESGCNALYGLAEFLGVFLRHLYVKHINAAINLEKQAFAFHYRFAAHGTDIAQAQHSRAIGNDRYKIALVCILVNAIGFFLNFQAWERHTWRIGQRQIGLRTIRFGRFHLDFTWPAILVVG